MKQPSRSSLSLLAPTTTHSKSCLVRWSSLYPSHTLTDTPMQHLANSHARSCKSLFPRPSPSSSTPSLPLTSPQTSMETPPSLPLTDTSRETAAGTRTSRPRGWPEPPLPLSTTRGNPSTRIFPVRISPMASEQRRLRPDRRNRGRGNETTQLREQRGPSTTCTRRVRQEGSARRARHAGTSSSPRLLLSRVKEREGDKTVGRRPTHSSHRGEALRLTPSPPPCRVHGQCPVVHVRRRWGADAQAPQSPRLQRRSEQAAGAVPEGD